MFSNITHFRFPIHPLENEHKDFAHHHSRAEMLKKLAMFTDRYDCAQVIERSVHPWMEELKAFGFSALASDVYPDTLLLIAFLFKDVELFARVSKHLIMRWEGDYTNMAGQDRIPQSVLGSLISHRTWNS